MSLKISRILHAGYVFECNGTQIAFDPIFENPFSRNCYAFPDVRFDYEQIKGLKLSAVFISHYHDDHCSLESLDLLDRNTPIYLYCIFEELFSWIKELGFTNVHSLAIDLPVRVGPFEVIPGKALDEDVDSIFHVKAAGLNVLNVVDSWIDPSTLDRLAQDAPWDMVLWPFQTMREVAVVAPSRSPEASTELPSEWLEQIKALNPKYIVPSSCQFVQESWSWYNHALFPITYRRFEEEMRSIVPNSRVVRLNPSVSLILEQDSLEEAAPLTWVQPIGEQNVDYRFKSELLPPATAEVSQRFRPLSSEEKDGVYEYCLSAILDKYRSLEPSVDPYFLEPRIWRLSVYDHAGCATHFYYKIYRGEIDLANEGDGPLAWLTEVPISKLFAALRCGESLTSMYVRINDTVFEPEIESEIASADVLEDPLVRCLFTGEFGSYQKEQLKRLRSQGWVEYQDI